LSRNRQERDGSNLFWEVATKHGDAGFQSEVLWGT